MLSIGPLGRRLRKKVYKGFYKPFLPSGNIVRVRPLHRQKKRTGTIQEKNLPGVGKARAGNGGSWVLGQCLRASGRVWQGMLMASNI